MPLLDEPLLLLLPEEEGLAVVVLEDDGRELEELCCGRTYSELERDGRELVGEV